MPSMPEPIPTERAIELVVWGTETVAAAVGSDCDPVEVRRAARSAIEGRAIVPPEVLLRAFEVVLREARLVAAPADLGAAALETTELPIVNLTGGLAVVSRAGSRYELARPGSPPEQVSADEARAAAAAAGGTWLTAAPAVPLQALAQTADHEHLSPLERLRGLMHLERDDLWVVVIYAAAVGLFTLATPIAVQSLVGSVAFGTLLQPIVVLSLLLLVALGFQAGLKALQTRVVESVQQRVFARTALDLAWRLPRMKPEAEGVGPEAANRFFEVVTIQKATAVLLTDGIATVLQIAIGMLVLAFYHPTLFAFDIVLMVIAALLVFAPARRGLSTSIDESYAKYEVAEWLQQLARSGQAFRGAGAAGMALERADALTRRYLTARNAHFAVLFRQALGTLGLQVFASAALLGLGGWLVVRRELTLGQLVAAEIIVTTVTSSIAKLGKLLESTYDLLTSLDKMGHVLDLPIEEDRHPERLPGQGPLRVDLATPAHSLTVKAGERVALAVPPGHAVADWLAGLRVPTEGVVRLNGVETRRARSADLHEDVVVIGLQGLFRGSVLENVTVGRDRITALEVRAALTRVELLDELNALPQGIDTVIDDEGRPLDASQALRVLVARALAGVPRLIVVNASLDGIGPRERQAVIAALTREGAPWTLISLVADAACPLARSSARVIDLPMTLAAPRREEVTS
ncbi:MAG: ABC transporter ATP-binding protein [Archangium sp.]|nr:ABC transporter ATP-binding protein [Archangium sp.]